MAVSRRPSTTALVLAGIAVAIALVVLVAPFASSAPDGLEKVSADTGIDAGATELDMVVNLGLVKAGEWLAVGDDIAAVRASTPRRSAISLPVVRGRVWSSSSSSSRREVGEAMHAVKHG